MKYQVELNVKTCSKCPFLNSSDTGENCKLLSHNIQEDEWSNINYQFEKGWKYEHCPLDEESYLKKNTPVKLVKENDKRFKVYYDWDKIINIYDRVKGFDISVMALVEIAEELHANVEEFKESEKRFIDKVGSCIVKYLNLTESNPSNNLMLKSICDELGIEYEETLDGVKYIGWGDD